LLPPDTEIATPEPASSSPEQPSFPLPAQYYSTPVSRKPLVASWVPFGCGGAALFFLVILFAGGSMMSGGGVSNLMDFMFDRMDEEIARMFASDVSPAQRDAFAAEMDTMRANIRNQKADFRLLQPIVKSMQEAISDKLVNASETDQLMREMRQVNAAAAKARPKKKP
jgi:hypothetical protein